VRLNKTHTTHFGTNTQVKTWSHLVATQLPQKALLMLTHIYNSMSRLIYFPTLGEFSVIIMILKPSASFHYSKHFLKKIVLKRILPTIESINLPNTQFGFIHNHLSVYQIHVHCLADNIFFVLEKKLICTDVFLGVARSFYLVWYFFFKLKTTLPLLLFIVWILSTRKTLPWIQDPLIPGPAQCGNKIGSRLGRH